RRVVKDAVVAPLLRGAASILAVGSAAQDSIIARGVPEERVRTFANTIDVERWIERAADISVRPRRKVTVLSVGRLAPDKGFDVLLRASAESEVELVLAGDGPERERL